MTHEALVAQLMAVVEQATERFRKSPVYVKYASRRSQGETDELEKEFVCAFMGGWMQCAHNLSRYEGAVNSQQIEKALGHIGKRLGFDVRPGKDG